MAKTRQDFINENRQLRKYNMEAGKEISELKKQLEKTEKELVEAKKTIAFYKEELLKAQILAVTNNKQGRGKHNKRESFRVNSQPSKSQDMNNTELFYQF